MARLTSFPFNPLTLTAPCLRSALPTHHPSYFLLTPCSICSIVPSLLPSPSSVSSTNSSLSLFSTLTFPQLSLMPSHFLPLSSVAPQLTNSSASFLLYFYHSRSSTLCLALGRPYPWLAQSTHQPHSFPRLSFPRFSSILGNFLVFLFPVTSISPQLSYLLINSTFVHHPCSSCLLTSTNQPPSYSYPHRRFACEPNLRSIHQKLFLFRFSPYTFPSAKSFVASVLLTSSSFSFLYIL